MHKNRKKKGRREAREGEREGKEGGWREGRKEEGIIWSLKTKKFLHLIWESSEFLAHGILLRCAQ